MHLELGDLVIQVASRAEIAEYPETDVVFDLEGLRTLAARGELPERLRFLVDGT